MKKIAVALDAEVVRQIDRWVREGQYPNRSRAVQAAVEEMMLRRCGARLAAEAAKLDAAEERALAEEGSRVETKDGYQGGPRVQKTSRSQATPEGGCASL